MMGQPQVLVWSLCNTYFLRFIHMKSSSFEMGTGQGVRSETLGCLHSTIHCPIPLTTSHFISSIRGMLEVEKCFNLPQSSTSILQLIDSVQWGWFKQWKRIQLSHFPSGPENTCHAQKQTMRGASCLIGRLPEVTEGCRLASQHPKAS